MGLWDKARLLCTLSTTLKPRTIRRWFRSLECFRTWRLANLWSSFGCYSKSLGRWFQAGCCCCFPSTRQAFHRSLEPARSRWRKMYQMTSSSSCLNYDHPWWELAWWTTGWLSCFSSTLSFASLWSCPPLGSNRRCLKSTSLFCSLKRPSKTGRFQTIFGASVSFQRMAASTSKWNSWQ